MLLLCVALVMGFYSHDSLVMSIAVKLVTAHDFQMIKTSILVLLFCSKQISEPLMTYPLYDSIIAAASNDLPILASP